MVAHLGNGLSQRRTFSCIGYPIVTTDKAIITKLNRKIRQVEYYI